MDKRILAAGGVGLVALVLGIILVGSPDTGGDVVEREIVRDTTEAESTASEEIVRSGSTAPSDGTDEGSATSGAPAVERGGLVSLDPATRGKPAVLQRVPQAKLDAVLRRQTAESEWAARAQAPWTEIRRQLAMRGADDELVDRAQALVDDIRAVRVDGTSRDMDELATEQAALAEEIRSSGLSNDEIEQMLVHVDTRNQQYENGQFEPR